MNYKRSAILTVAFLALLALATDPALAWVPDYNSDIHQLVSELNAKFLYLAIPVTIFVEAILIYAVLKFRNNDDPKPTEENRRLEITWTVATAIILLFVGFSSYTVMAEVTTPPAAEPNEEDIQVDVTAGTWYWNFEYPEENVSTSGELVIPANQPIFLNITSDDWIHAVHIPALHVKQDAMPGEYKQLRFTPTEPGQYQLYCAEYCGDGHSGMLATVRVVPQDEYQQWLNEQRNQGNTIDDPETDE